MSKAHVVCVTELPVVTTGGIRVELSCPSGCIQGYLWSRSAEAADSVREAALAVAATHSASPTGAAELEEGSEGSG